ncbi:HAD family hydrolase [Parasphingopyxis lamellibrachiae]|uniref:2-haloacid dehalogenase n=1 Tax=Parasphingopyxis lamellibrachiae TaxID=680125 RepID=A0A3D9FHZ1_9SPHN|nr:HAD family phosphatase [Parasphingopyxis lamellibrachiae]RED17268.1 2-haloacid dehalogenase [Parasphingopyxis lamellibrachiae]
MAVRAAVFDVGNVLYRWDPRFLFEKLIPDPQERDWFLQNVVTMDWHAQHDAGRPLAAMVAERSAKFPKYAGLIQAYVDRWLETIPGPVPGVHPLVAELARRDIPLFAITNFGAEFWELFRPEAPVIGHFADIVISGREKLIKPDPAIYRLALERFSLEPGEALFIDDREENIRAGEKEGFVGHHFTDADRLAEALRGHGFLA